MLLTAALGSDQGGRTSTSRNFVCWTEIENPGADARFTLAGAFTRDAVAISGQAVKVPFGGISDIPGPVTLLGLLPTDADRSRSMDQAYIVKWFDGTNLKTVFVPF